jgi:hypothetical protein
MYGCGSIISQQYNANFFATGMDRVTAAMVDHEITRITRVEGVKLPVIPCRNYADPGQQETRD